MTRPKLHVLDLGRLDVESRMLIGDGPSPFPERVEIPVSAYCLDHPDGRVLFDTGCHPQAMGPDGRWPAAAQRDYPHLGGEACCLPNRLEQLGLGPDDFRTVVLSHMHNDHAGCVEFFSKSRLVVHAAEFAAAQQAYRRREDEFYTWRDTDAWIRADLDWRTLRDEDGDVVLQDGVRVLNLGPGHAFGMLGLEVVLPETGRIILASDALYCPENFAASPRVPLWVEDVAGYRATVARIRNLAEGAQVWFGHDPRQFATLRKSTEGWYE